MLRQSEFDGRVAILSASGRFPGVAGVAGLRQASLAGQSLIKHFERDEMLRDGVSRRDVDAPNYVPAKGWLANSDIFDARAFGISPSEALMMDPQQRVLLEECAVALDEAAIDPGRFDGRIGIFAGQFISTYLLHQLVPAMAGNTDPIALATVFQGNTVDQLAARVAYRLDLRGPAITVQTACSTSLVAVHMSCASLLSGECDIAIAGGITLSFPARSGYFYAEGGIHSKLGVCRPFDAAADGTVFGDGVGVVVLARASDALEAGYPIRAVIRSTAINNDGARKAGHTAPSVDGQKSVLAEALEMAGVPAAMIGYIETHGTGTPIGDLIEMTAINAVYLREGGRAPLVVGALKANTGHLEAAAGVAGLIRAIDVIETGAIPPIAGLRTVNPLLGTERLPIIFPTSRRAWPSGQSPRRAAISAFGVGGTNAHVIIEQSPIVAGRSVPMNVARLVPISGSSRATAAMNANAIAAAIEAMENPSNAEIQKTLALGRPQQAFRSTVVLGSDSRSGARLSGLSFHDAVSASRVVLIAPGQGTLVSGAAKELYRIDPHFGDCLDAVATPLLDRLQVDVRALLFDADAERLRTTAHAHPAGFALSLALASWLDRLDVPVSCIVGHSLGEFVSAVRAGILSLDDALDLVVARGKIISELPDGAMILVMRSAAELVSAFDLAGHGLDIACYNGPEQTVLAGSREAISAARARLRDLHIACVELPVSHAFHSRMMAPAEKRWRDLLRKVSFIPRDSTFFSSTLGRAVDGKTVATVDYWVEHLLRPVRFADALRAAATAAQTSRIALVELGTTSGLARGAEQALRAMGLDAHAVGLLGDSEQQPRDEQAFAALGRLWSLGVALKWDALVEPAARRIALPPRHFESTRYFMDGPRLADASNVPRAVNGSELKRPAYRTFALGRPQISDRQRRWLIIAASEESVADLIEHLLDHGQIATVAVPGPERRRLRRGVYQMPLQSGTAWLEFLRELRSLVRTPNVIVHTLALAPGFMLESGMADLGALAGALARESTNDSHQLGIVAPSVRPVLGSENLNPGAAGLAAAACVLEQETPRLKACFIDLPEAGNGSAERIDKHQAELVTEILLDGAIDAASIRGRRLFQQEFEILEEPSDAPSPYRRGGLYLVIGGGGGLGRLVADDLARRFDALVIVASRHADGIDRFENWPPSAPHTPGVIAMAADVTKPAELESVLLQIRRRFGNITGIIHAAGLPGGQAIAASGTGENAEVVAPKWHGLDNIADCIHRHGPWPELDFVVTFSSTATIVGGPGQGAYAAANAAMDASIFNLGRAGPVRWATVLWDTVENTGMAARGQADRLSPLAEARRALAIDPSHCARLLERALGSSGEMTIISRAEAAELPTFHTRIKQLFDIEVIRVERPELATEYSPPRNELEERLTALWSRALGVERIGINDRFFDLGGHSLLAAQLRGQIKTAFDVDLPISSIFAADTVAAMAAFLETAILGELQSADEKA
jgi:acyl transferase domain-containing protein/acyl carrier protein